MPRPAIYSVVLLTLVLATVTGCQDQAGPKPNPPTVTASEASTEPSPAEPAAQLNEPEAQSTATTVEPKPKVPEPAVAAETSPTTPPAEEKPAETKPAAPPPEVEGLPRLAKEYEVWLDKKQNRVLVGGQIVRTEGQLEMFACLKNSKEHESIVAVNTKAINVNAALIALGANPGGPVQFRPEFKPASGPEVEVTVIWTDKEGKRQQARGQDWIRDLKTGKTLSHPWVFAGSGFWEDQDSGQRHFMAEDGDFICISNFTSAMLDVPVESSQATADLQFEAFTERIPPVGTPVLLVLSPKLKKSEETAKATND
jgi:hypothetical protein